MVPVAAATINRAWNRRIDTCPLELMHGISRDGRVLNDQERTNAIETAISKTIQDRDYHIDLFFRKHKRVPKGFEVGQSVLAYSYPQNKLQRSWVGPFLVAERLSRSVYILSDGRKARSSQLKHFFE